MLKEVGASGQISLGKRYAGQLFDVITEADNTIVLRPVKVVPVAAVVQEAPTTTAAMTSQWAKDNAPSIAEYNAWAEQREPYAQRVRRWRETGK
jgi:uncharacterized FlgJ-related protein